MVEVTIIIPSMNEENTIGEVIQKAKKMLEKTGLNGEIVVVDNSTDKTPEIATKMGAKVIRGVKGYGKAYLEGFKVAKGKYIVLADADGTYDLSEASKLLEPLIKNEADIVIGSRLKGEIKPGAMPWLHRYIGNPLLTWVMNRLFGTNISDGHSGMRALKRSVIERLNLKCLGMEFASEMLIEAVKRGLRIKEVPITYYPRKGRSKLRSFRDGWRHLRFMLLYSPSVLFFIPGLMGIFTGAVLMGYVLLLDPIRTHTIILGSLLSLIGFQLLSFGISNKVYAAEFGLVEPDRITRLFMRYSVLEEGLMLGSALVLFGLFMGWRIFNIWAQSGYGGLNQVNHAILVLTLIALGLQIIFTSFFISSLLIKSESR